MDFCTRLEMKFLNTPPFAGVLSLLNFFEGGGGGLKLLNIGVTSTLSRDRSLLISLNLPCMGLTCCLADHLSSGSISSLMNLWMMVPSLYGGPGLIIGASGGGGGGGLFLTTLTSSLLEGCFPLRVILVSRFSI